jgi:predicted nucleotidyltransferase
MEHQSIHETFTAALDALVGQIKTDHSILAAILCGSLSHDTVWSRSDIDLVLVTIDDKLVGPTDLALYADGVPVHAILIPRAEFRKTVEGSVHHSFIHSFLAKGRLLYSHDPTIGDLMARLREIGDHDARVQMLRAATGALGAMHKAHKWLATRGDLEYTALWILYAATPLAQIEVIGARRLVDREAIPLAAALNPPFFRTIYTDLLNEEKTAVRVQAALDAADAYLSERAGALFGLIIDHLKEAGEARASSELEHHFTRHMDVSGVTIACEYLADRGLIGKASLPIRLTRKSRVDVQELAFFHRGGGS